MQKRSGKIHACFILLVFAGLFTSCGDDAELVNESIYEAVRKDGVLDKSEYAKISKTVEALPDDFRSLLGDDNKIRCTAWVDYVERLARNRKVNVKHDNIWCVGKDAAIEKNVIDVFLENSKSMDGYVKGQTKFENTIYNMLVDLKISGYCSAMNLNYINASVPFTMKNAKDEELDDFIRKLEPATFQERGGNRSVSDIRNIIDTALSTVGGNRVSILISDFVFSPGRKHADALEYLNNQRVGMKSTIARKLSQHEISVLLLKLHSEFNGTYYNQFDTPVQLRQVIRPYYVMIMASPAVMNTLLQSTALHPLVSDGSDFMLLHPAKTPDAMPVKLIFSNRTGNFEPDPADPQRALAEATVSEAPKTMGQFGFWIAARNSNYYLPEYQVYDSLNYEISNADYSLYIRENDGTTINGTEGYETLMQLKTKKLKEEALTVSLLCRIPGWIDETHSVNDQEIVTRPDEQLKTFGIRDLATGLFEAYRIYSNPADKKNTDRYILSQFSIHIKPKE